MKYWILFAVKVLARAGLGFVALSWCLSASQLFMFGAHLTQHGLLIKVHPCGWNFVHLHYLSDSPGWWCESERITDGAGWAMQFRDTVPQAAGVLPGMYYASGVRSGTLFIDHWLICLAFLIATIMTSVTWKKRGPRSEQAGPAE